MTQLIQKFPNNKRICKTFVKQYNRIQRANNYFLNHVFGTYHCGIWNPNSTKSETEIKLYRFLTKSMFEKHLMLLTNGIDIFTHNLILPSIKSNSDSYTINIQNKLDREQSIQFMNSLFFRLYVDDFGSDFIKITILPVMYKQCDNLISIDDHINKIDDCIISDGIKLIEKSIQSKFDYKSNNVEKPIDNITDSKLELNVPNVPNELIDKIQARVNEIDNQIELLMKQKEELLSHIPKIEKEYLNITNSIFTLNETYHKLGL